MLRKEYQASNFTFEKQIQTLEREKISLETIQINLREKVKQLEEQHDSNAKLLSEQRDEIEQSQSHVKSLEKEKKSLEAIQITLREKVEEVEDQRDSNAKLLRAQSDEIKQLQERVKPLSSGQETKVAPSESLGCNSNIQYFQSLSQNFAYWVGNMVFLFFVGFLIYECVMAPTHRFGILIIFGMILCWWLLLVAFRWNGDIHFARLGGESLIVFLFRFWWDDFKVLLRKYEPLGEMLVVLSCWWWGNDFIFISTLLFCAKFFARQCDDGRRPLMISEYIGILIVEIIYLVSPILANYYWSL